MMFRMLSVGAALLLCTAVYAGKIPTVLRVETGKVVSVTDGDTVRVLIGTEQIRVRLEGIDAPESKQPFGQRSKERLLELVGGKTVQVHVTGTDRYGRTLGKLLIDGNDINQQMLLDGMAWHFVRYNSEPEYAASQQQAQQTKKGLWSDPTPTPPWKFRKR